MAYDHYSNDDAYPLVKNFKMQSRASVKVKMHAKIP